MKIIKGWAGVSFATALAVVFYQFNPAKLSWFPKCPFHYLTGLNCPGCGSQRAIHALLHGEFLKAMDYNLLLIVSLPFFTIHYGYVTASLVKGKNIQWKLMHDRFTPIIVFVITIVFWILRNVPYKPFNWLAA